MAAEGGVLERIRSLRAEGPSSPAETMSLARALAADPQARERLLPVRLVLLSSFTTTLFDPSLKVEAARQGFLVDIHHGGFGQFEQALLGDEWRSREAGARATEALVVMMRLEDLHPDVGFRVYTDSPDGPDEAWEALSANVLARIESTLSIFRDRSNGPALVASFSMPEPRIGPIFDANLPGSLTYKLQALNRALLERVSQRAACHVWDYAGLVSAAGSARWTDPRLWALSRTPVSAANQPVLARHLTRTLRGALRPAAKCLVLDLDNTLWGGVIGDDGVTGIQLGDEHPGRAFKELQRAALGLRDRGILLAICSKNDPAVVHDALANHPEMLLKLKDFAATRINWSPKSQNLREIAKELNIGLDSLVFFDDNPVERAEVMEGAPEVQVVDVPVDPALYVRTLCDVAAFDAPSLTAEDRLRAQSYQAQIERRESEAHAGSLDEFLPSLQMEVAIGSWNAMTAQRIAQLVIKTNQFNTTTRRVSEAELAALHEGGLGVYWLRLTDRYGDMGLIAVAVLTKDGTDAVIHTFVLSCRAANRAMEQTLVAYLAKKARDGGCTRLIGEFIPTPKNTPVVDLFPKLGFVLVETQPHDGVTRYAYDLSKEDLIIPAFIRVREEPSL